MSVNMNDRIFFGFHNPWDSITSKAQDFNFNLRRLFVARNSLTPKPALIEMVTGADRPTLSARAFLNLSAVPRPFTHPALRTLLRDRIAGSPDKRIPFADFMEECLYSPSGYYCGGADQIGKGSDSQKDFTTSPEIMPKLFGGCTGEYLYNMWLTMDRPRVFNIIEMGAGNGTWAKSILEFLRKYRQDLFSVLSYHILEISPALAQKQRQTFLNSELPVDWVAGSALELPFKSVTGAFISNEQGTKLRKLLSISWQMF